MSAYFGAVTAIFVEDTRPQHLVGFKKLYSLHVIITDAVRRDYYYDWLNTEGDHVGYAKLFKDNAAALNDLSIDLHSKERFQYFAGDVISGWPAGRFPQITVKRNEPENGLKACFMIKSETGVAAQQQQLFATSIASALAVVNVLKFGYLQVFVGSTDDLVSLRGIAERSRFLQHLEVKTSLNSVHSPAVMVELFMVIEEIKRFTLAEEQKGDILFKTLDANARAMLVARLPSGRYYPELFVDVPIVTLTLHNAIKNTISAYSRHLAQLTQLTDLKLFDSNYELLAMTLARIPDKRALSQLRRLTAHAAARDKLEFLRVIERDILPALEWLMLIVADATHVAAVEDWFTGRTKWKKVSSTETAVTFQYNDNVLHRFGSQ